MSEKNFKPSAVEKIVTATNNIIEQMMDMGLKYRDVKLLIRDRTGNKINMTDIDLVLKAIQSIEDQFIKSQRDEQYE